ncbi:MAG: hypothetical protein ABSF70_07240 [Terracidiphilus sp.]|jgi:hypothetical protein
MRRFLLGGLGGFAICALLSTVVLAGSRNPADFPLRVHIYTHNGVSHYYNQSLQTVDGEGRANLFENGEPRGFDYRYSCENRLMNSAGYETYLARWKKPGKTLEILLPAMGGTCEMKVELKTDIVYRRHKGLLGEESAARYKEWMDKHQYDPEHGKNIPIAVEPEPAQTPAGGGTSEPN